MLIWLADDEAEANIENADRCYALLNTLKRPWEGSEKAKKYKYTAEELIEMYLNKFPEELKQEE